MLRATILTLAVALASFAPAFFAKAAEAKAAEAKPVSVVTRYRSPKNAERRVRKATELVVLHTTEAPARSSLRHLSDRGECHYCVTEDGTVYQIVDRHRVAFHAGRSMWNGKEDVDEFAVGIECVGYHDKAMPAAQLKSIKALVKELQRLYSIPDHCVVTHSQVAYGDVNKWQKKKHRGRKRCGMLFAMPSVRAQLGLKSRAAFDPDVKAKRLVIGDSYLNNVLYANVDTMARHYGKNGVAAAAPAKKAGWISRLLGVGIGAKSTPAPAPVAEQKAIKAAPVKPQPKPKTGPPASISELKARGYVQKGVVSKEKTAIKIAGSRWNSADTYYTIRNKVIPGSSIDAARIEKGMAVWMKPK